MTVAFTDNGFNLFNWGAIKGLIGSLLLTIVQFLCVGVFFLENVFWVLIRGVKMQDGSYKNLIDGLLFNGTNLADNQITKITGIIVLIALALVVVASVIAVIKSNFSTKDEDKSPKTAVIGVVKAIVLMIAFPLLIYCLLLITNTLTNAICQYANFDATDKNSVANQLFFMFMSKGGNQTCIAADGTRLFSFTLDDLASCGFAGDNPWQQLISAGFIDGTNQDGLFGYDYIIAIIVLIILIVALFKAALLLVRRVFDIIVLYVIAPLPIACYPSDEGKRFDIWKDLISSKVISSFGIGLTFVVYSILITVLYETFATWSTQLGCSFKCLDLGIINGQVDTGTILTIVYIIVIIAGALAIPNMYSMMATLVSSQAGMVAQHDLQNMSNDMAYFQRAGMKAEKAALGGTALMLKALKTGAIGNRDMRYLNAMRKSSGAAANSGAIKNTAWNFAGGGLIGGTYSSISGAISSHRSDRLDAKADELRSNAIRNYDNKFTLSSANAELNRMHRPEVTARDVLAEEGRERMEHRADEAARRRRGGR